MNNNFLMLVFYARTLSKVTLQKILEIYQIYRYISCTRSRFVCVFIVILQRQACYDCTKSIILLQTLPVQRNSHYYLR